MVDFVSYVLFLCVGMVLGAVLGVRFMRWYWWGAKEQDKSDTMFWVALFVACSYFGARRFF